jgi:antitoxin ChpS
MHTTNLRKVGGSVMLAVPPAILELLQLRAGATVGVSVEAGRLIVQPDPQPRYSLEALLEGSDYANPRSAEEQHWLDSSAVGRELL